MPPIRVVVINANPVISAGLRSVLDQSPEMHVLAAVSTGERGLKLIEQLEPDVALVDHELPDMSGVEICEAVRRTSSRVASIVVSLTLVDTIVSRCLRAGARGYLHVTVTSEELVRSVIAVANGQAVLDPRVVSAVTRSARRMWDEGQRSLSRREVEVLHLIGDGATDGHIATMLGVSRNTVKTYIRRSLEKLGSVSRSEAVARVGRLRLASVDAGGER